MVPFVREMIQLYAGGPASNSALSRRDSDPQRERPAAWATAAMRLMPYASMGTVLGIALIGGGLLAASRAGSRPGGA
jgi:protease I